MASSSPFLSAIQPGICSVKFLHWKLTSSSSPVTFASVLVAVFVPVPQGVATLRLQKKESLDPAGLRIRTKVPPSRKSQPFVMIVTETVDDDEDQDWSLGTDRTREAVKKKKSRNLRAAPQNRSRRMAKIAGSNY
mmetsp:Transcript_45516/g.177017  ORF Transcript_45516/g.177017 Transcript_45516/m.177017 type:complete len:135 (-) Transcript_45516:1197-1601(-)